MAAKNSCNSCGVSNKSYWVTYQIAHLDSTLCQICGDAKWIYYANTYSIKLCSGCFFKYVQEVISYDEQRHDLLYVECIFTQQFMSVIQKGSIPFCVECFYNKTPHVNNIVNSMKDLWERTHILVHMWEMDSVRYDNALQWLPKELLENIIEIYFPKRTNIW